MMMRFPGIATLALLAGLTCAQAQDYPSRPITLVVPYAAGGGNDLFARIASEKMSRTLGQQIVIENRPGAGGSTATRAVAKAAPDGYTLVIGGTGTLAVNPTLYQNVGYDPRKDFAPVGLIGTSALVVLTNPSLPARNIRELIALAKKDPGKINYASRMCLIVAARRRSPISSAGMSRSISRRCRPQWVSSAKARCARSPSPASSAPRSSPTCRPSQKQACRASRPCCTMAS